jgi:hypothetical protein
MLKKLKEAAAEQGTTLPLLLLSDCTQVCVRVCFLSGTCVVPNTCMYSSIRVAIRHVCVIRHSCVMLVHFAEFSPHKGV